MVVCLYNIEYTYWFKPQFIKLIFKVVF